MGSLRFVLVKRGHIRGRRCSLNNTLRILHTGKAIRSAYSRRSQFRILSGQHNLQGLSRILLSRHLSWMFPSRNLGRSFSRARQVMRRDGQYSSRGSRNALFIEFANSPLNRFISLHQALAFLFFFWLCKAFFLG